MAEVVGVRFKDAGKVYYFDPAGIRLEKGDHAIVETARGMECGFVAMGNRDVAEDEIVFPLKAVTRKATEADLARVEDNARREKEAFAICEDVYKRQSWDASRSRFTPFLRRRAPQTPAAPGTTLPG